ncbi:MAG TPA: hypothetical protein VIN09_07445 [Chloroflexota bacterium]
MREDSEVVVRLTRRQANAAAAVLRGYLAHQRERLGDQAEANENFRLVKGALEAIEAFSSEHGRG